MKLEDFTSDTQGMQSLIISYASGGQVDICPKQRIIVQYNTGDVILYVYRNGEYILDMIRTFDGQTVLLNNLSLE